MNIISLAGHSDRANSSFNHFWVFFKALPKSFLLRFTSLSELLLWNSQAAFVFECCQNFGNFLIPMLQRNCSHCCDAQPCFSTEVATKLLWVWEWRMLLSLHAPPLLDALLRPCILVLPPHTVPCEPYVWCVPGPLAFFQSVCVAGSVLRARGTNIILHSSPFLRALSRCLCCFETDPGREQEFGYRIIKLRKKNLFQYYNNSFF